MNLSHQLREYVAACFTGLWVISHEHEDALREIAQMCRQEGWRLGVLDVKRGLQVPGAERPDEAGGSDPLAAIAALGALAIAIPSFRTRGDYLAIISLAFMFIIKSMIENLEIVGGPRGLSSHPDYVNLPTIFAWSVASIWIINNFVRSTIGKALNAVRDD